MAKGDINLKGVISDIVKNSVYYPLFEGIVNGIHAIIENNNKDGEIIIKVLRSNQLGGLDGSKDLLGDIEGFEIIDNGIGFNLKNQKSFNTYRSDYKLIDFGGKGFGRFFYLKFFKDVKFERI